ncbi:MAG TPA: biotin--[acetyl-CoA-carboxylase] ligase [Ktedonobacteraceae bacterium]|nr:biotin--[acetyl-CoA-carboxylase] ligase [Ktedonobacteraceae bacterium]
MGLHSTREDAFFLDKEELERFLDTQYFGVGNRLQYLPTIDSTNSWTMQLAREGSDEGLVVLTDSQTAGRGRQGRRWVDVPGHNVLLSILLRPRFQPHLLVMLASLAVVDAIRETCGVMARIKWPNDVLIEGRKVAGILIETSHDVQGRFVAVLGIGVNVNGRIDEVSRQLGEQAALVAEATTLEAASGSTVSREAFIASLLRHIEKSYIELQQEADSSHIGAVQDVSCSRVLRERWRGQLSTLGRMVSVRQGETVISGIAEDVDGNGELLLRRHSGELVTITWGSIEQPSG